MLSKRIILLFLTILVVQKKFIPLINYTAVSNSRSTTAITWAQVCSCKSYHGIPHTCYYSPVSDPDHSCIAKCIREANQ